MKKVTRISQKNITQSTIINAAWSIFSSLGFVDANIRDIAKHGSISTGSVLVHFGTKEKLVDFIIERLKDQITLDLAKRQPKTITLIDILSIQLDVLFLYERIYIRLLQESNKLSEKTQNEFISIQSLFSEHLSQALTKDYLNSNSMVLPSKMLFNVWIGLVHHYLLNSEKFAPKESVIMICKNQIIRAYMILVSNMEDVDDKMHIMRKKHQI
jgi:AcrR family transcriptional regulator